MIDALGNLFPGYKTHLAVAAGLVTVGAMFWSGDLAAMEAMTRVFELLGISGLRMGVASKK